MTKEKLINLKKIKKEIEQIKTQIENLDVELTQDSVTGSENNFPYIKRNFTIKGYAYGDYENKIERLQNKLKKKLHELMDERDSADDFINSVEDSDVRQILRYRYIDGLCWEQIGYNMGYSWETVRKKHDNYLKNIPVNTTSNVVK
jgi:hypothetical protein